MPSAKVAVLTRQDITKAARSLEWPKRMTKWSAMVEGKEFPARQLVLHAAGVAPNDATNSHQAVALLKALGFETSYEGKPA